MVAQDVATFWDLKPNRENTNVLFNVLCNVQPVEHPRSGDGYARQIDVTTGSKQQFRLEKCKGLKKCELYEYDCYGGKPELVIPYDDADSDRARLKKRRAEKMWGNANFTDVIVFNGYRLYMRRTDLVLNPYGDEQKKYNGKVYVDEGEPKGGGDYCGDYKYPSSSVEHTSVDSTITDETLSDDKINTFNTSSRMRIYIQQIDVKDCTGDTFDSADEAPIVCVYEKDVDHCNPDHFIMGYGGKGIPEFIEDAVLYMIRYGGQAFAYMIPKDNKHISQFNSLYIEEKGIYISGLQEPTGEQTGILSDLDIPMGGYRIPEVGELLQFYAIYNNSDNTKNGLEKHNMGNIYSYKEAGEIPYFISGDTIYGIHSLYSVADEYIDEDGKTKKINQCNVPNKNDIHKYVTGNVIEERNGCDENGVDAFKRRIFLFADEVPTISNGETITGITSWNNRFVYIKGNMMFITGEGQYLGVATKDMTGNSNFFLGGYNIPAGITSVKNIGGSLILLGPKTIYGVIANNGILTFVNGTDNEDGYFSQSSFHNDDGEFLLFRRGKILGRLDVQVGYTGSSMSITFDPSVGFFVNSHLKSLNNNHDYVNIDADINNRYVSIYDNNDVGEHYSKLLIYDKHYNFWYHWIITGARIIHVKDGIFLGDGIYVNKGRTWGWKKDDTEGGEIIEIISAYLGEEGLQTPKHIQYVKTAIGDHSVITNDSYRDIDTSYGGKLFERRNNITATRYPKLLTLKDSKKQIETYEIGEEIYGHGKLLSHNLLNEISEYRNYDKFSNLILREMGEYSDMKSTIARFASIKEPINAPANVLELCISARHLDNVQFGSFYVGYYQLDADYEDIENTNIDASLVSDRTKEYETVINRGEYCNEILEGSVCDTE